MLSNQMAIPKAVLVGPHFIQSKHSLIIPAFIIALFKVAYYHQPINPIGSSILALHNSSFSFLLLELRLKDIGRR